MSVGSFLWKFLLVILSASALATAWIISSISSNGSFPRPSSKLHSVSLTKSSVPSASSTLTSPNNKQQQLGSFEALDVPDNEPKRRRVRLLDWLTTTTTTKEQPGIAFEAAWDVQKQLLQQQVDRLKQQRQGGVSTASSFLPSDNGDLLSPPPLPNGVEPGLSDDWEDNYDPKSAGGVDTVLFLEHAPTYTLGTRSDTKYLLFNMDDDNDNHHDVVPIDRGGEVTFHGPGQLVVYPVLDLRSYKQDLHWYLRALEEAVLVALRLCAENDSLEQTNNKDASPTPTPHPLSTLARRDDDTTGVWVDDCKVAAMGVKVRNWITQHGLSVNVEQSSLEGFEHIVPCGLEGRQVGCVNQFLHRPVSVRDFAAYMESALQQVFQIELVRQDEGTN